MTPHRLSLRPAVAAALLLALSPLAAPAQEGAALRVRGEIASFDGQVLTVATREGATALVELAPGARVVGVAEASLADIGPGSYLGVASLPLEDGRDAALEVLIFPEAMAGTGEGSFPWDLEPDSTMTNATVASVDQVNGDELTLTWEGESRRVLVPEGAPIVTFAEAAPGDLTPGKTVFVPGHAGPGDIVTTETVVVETDGVEPPM